MQKYMDIIKKLYPLYNNAILMNKMFEKRA